MNRFSAMTVAVAISVASLAGQVSAQEVSPGIFRVDKGATTKVDRYSVCRNVKNNSSEAIMVPAGDPSEWYNGEAAFLNNVNKMPGVDATACLDPDAILAGYLNHETCLNGNNNPLDCERTRGPKAGQYIPHNDPGPGYWWITSTLPHCIVDGKTGNLRGELGGSNIRGANPANTTTKPEIDISYETAMKVLNHEFPINEVRFPPGKKECNLNMQISHVHGVDGGYGGYFISYVFKRP